MGSYSARNDRTGSGKPMETLPGPKTAIKKSKIQKMTENSQNPEFRIFPWRALYFSSGLFGVTRWGHFWPGPRAKHVYHYEVGYIPNPFVFFGFLF